MLQCDQREMDFRIAAKLCIRCGFYYQVNARNLCEACTAKARTRGLSGRLTQLDRQWRHDSLPTARVVKIDKQEVAFRVSAGLCILCGDYEANRQNLCRYCLADLERTTNRRLRA